MSGPHDISEMKGYIISRQASLSPQVVAVLKLSLDRPETVAFGTVKSLAEATGVGNATVVRAAQSLGFESFRDFRKIFQEHVRRPQGATVIAAEKTF